jgi:hypothetical protein
VPEEPTVRLPPEEGEEVNYPRSNPTRVRTVTIIVTHEDERRDFSRTYTANEICAEDVGYWDRSDRGEKFRDWRMTTIEGLEP